MDVIRGFTENELNIEVSIKGDELNPLFRAQDVGAVLGIKFIHSSIRNLTEHDKVILSIETMGGNQDVTYLTEQGLYKVLFRSNAPIAVTFQNWVVAVIRDIRLQGSQRWKKEVDAISESKTNAEIMHGFVLERAFDRKRCFYVAKVKELENDSFVIKIGRSDEGLQQRMEEHRKTYGMAVCLHVVECIEERKFENFIKKRFSHHKYEWGTHIELLLINEKLTISDLVVFVTKQANKFNLGGDIGYKLKYEQLQDNYNALVDALKNTTKPIIIKTCIATQTDEYDFNDDYIPPSEMVTTATVTSTENVEEIIQSVPAPPINNPNARIIQMIDPVDLTKVVQVFTSPKEACSRFDMMTWERLKSNIANSTVYHGYRWKFIEECQTDHDVVMNIEDTQGDLVQAQDRQFIVKCDREFTCVIKVFSSQIECAKIINTQRSTLCEAVKSGKELDGYKYVKWNDVNDIVRKSYIETHGIPHLHYVTKVVKRYCANTKQLMGVYRCRKVAALKCGIGQTKLRSLLSEPIPVEYRGSIFVEVDDAIVRYAE